MRLKPRSVRARITIWSVAVLATIILTFALGVYWFLQASLLRTMDTHLDRDFATVERVARQGQDGLDLLIRHGNVQLFQVREGQRVVAQSAGWSGAGLPATSQASGPTWIAAGTDGVSYRFRSEWVSFPTGPRLVAVAHDGQSYRQNMRSLAMVLLLGIPVSLLLAVAGGYFLAGRTLAPLGAMAAKAREISAERLSERLPVEHSDDEFGQLALVFNNTIEHLEQAFERLSRFTADASHELRTPLTAIRSVGEVGMQHDVDAAGCREVIGSMLEEADRLTKLVDSLLVLCRADAGRIVLTRETTDLSALASDVCDCLQVLAEEKGQALSLAAAQPVLAAVDRATASQALINLLDNAIKYSPAGGFIQVAVQVASSEATITVSDDGPGIPAHHRQKIFERFYRVDRGRSREVGGAGLGLSIAQWAVQVNGGRLELESGEGSGSTFRICLPLAA